MKKQRATMSLAASVVFVALLMPMFAFACSHPEDAMPSSSFNNLHAVFTRFLR